MPNDMAMAEGFFAFCERRDAERRARKVSLVPPLPPVRPAVAAECWCDYGMIPEEWDAALEIDFDALDALRRWQALHHDHGMSGADAAAIVCGEG